MARRQGSRFQTGGRKRVTDWGLGPGSEALTTISASGKASLGSAIQPSTKLTVVRT